MAISPDQFRLDFKAFADTTKYDDGMVNFWLNVGYALVPAQLWGGLVDFGVELFVAHNLTLEGLSNAEGANGAPPGTTVGPVTTKTVGELTVVYDAASGVNAADQAWNLSNYGTRFVKLAKQFGSIPTQLGIGLTPPLNGPAWPGFIYPFSGG